MSHDEEDHRMYYCQQEHGYWSGTLIRIRTVKDNKQSNENEEFYEIKIYNRYEARKETHFNRNVNLSFLCFIFHLQRSNQNKQSVQNLHQ